jgi:hypothetical protein
MRAYYFPGVPVVETGTGTGTGNGTTTVSGDKSYTHSQPSASVEWVVHHNLGKYPAIAIVDSAGREVFGGVQHVDANTTIVTFTAPFSGKVYCN